MIRVSEECFKKYYNLLKYYKVDQGIPCDMCPLKEVYKKAHRNNCIEFDKQNKNIYKDGWSCVAFVKKAFPSYVSFKKENSI